MNKQVKLGLKIEREHRGTVKFIKSFYNKNKKFPTDTQIFKHIAKDHIKENSTYYTKLSKMEKSFKRK